MSVLFSLQPPCQLLQQVKLPMLGKTSGKNNVYYNDDYLTCHFFRLGWHHKSELLGIVAVELVTGWTPFLLPTNNVKSMIIYYYYYIIILLLLLL